MSLTIYICQTPIPENDATAWKQATDWAEQEVIGLNEDVPPVFHELITRLTAKYPCICDLLDDKADNSPWSDGPLRNNIGRKVTILGMMNSGSSSEACRF